MRRQETCLVVDQDGRVDGVQTVERGAEVGPAVRATDGFGQSQSANDGLLLVDGGPRSGGRSTLHNRLTEQVATERRQEVHGDASGAGRLAEQGDVVGVAAEESDVGVDPLEGRYLIEHAHVARRARLVEVEKSERRDPVLERDVDDVLFGDEDLWVVNFQGRRSSNESATKDPDHDGRVLGARARDRHAEVQTVLAPLRVGVPHGRPGKVAEEVVHRLPARIWHVSRVPDVIPRVHRSRVAEAQLAHRRLGERDAVPHVHLLTGRRLRRHPAHATRKRIDYQGRIFRRRRISCSCPAITTTTTTGCYCPVPR